MAERRPTMMDPSVEVLLSRVDSKFTLVSLAAKRGRQVIAYFNQLGEGLGAIVPPQVTSISRKPLSIALEEVAAGKITYHRLADPDLVEAEADTDGEGSEPTGSEATSSDAAASPETSPEVVA